MTKICTKCGEEKELSEYHKHKNGLYGKKPHCKICDASYKINYRRTKVGLIKRNYDTQTGGSNRRGHKKQNYTPQELVNWALSKDIFHKLHNAWVNSGFLKELSPSFDRKDSSKSYTLDNLQIMTWGDNNKKGRIECSKKTYKVLNGKILEEYISRREAGRLNDIREQNISQSSLKVGKAAGGYFWATEDTLKETLEYSKTHSPTRRKYRKYKSSDKVTQLDLDGNFIKTWDSIKEAAGALNTKVSNIQRALGLEGRSCSGFMWKSSEYTPTKRKTK